MGTVFLDNHAEMVSPINANGQKASDILYEGADWGADLTFYTNVETVFNDFLSKP